MSSDRAQVSVEQLIALGREHYNANEYERAEPFLAEAASARPSFPDPWNERRRDIEAEFPLPHSGPVATPIIKV